MLRLLGIAVFCVVLALCASPPHIASAQSVPGSPTGLDAVGGSSIVTLTWDAPADVGSPPLTEYQYSSNGGSSWRDTNNIFTTFDVRSLRNGQQYSFRVRAKNATGTSAQSSSVSASPIARTIPTTGSPQIIGGAGTRYNPYLISNPEDVYNFSILNKMRYGSTNDQNRASAEWTNIVTFFQFQPEAGTETGTEDRSWSISITATPSSVDFDVSDSTLSTTYRSTTEEYPERYVSVKFNPPDKYLFAVWRFGDPEEQTSSPSSGASTLTLTLNKNEVPDAPTEFSATPDDEQVILEWTPPLNDGGAPITHYEYTTTLNERYWISTHSTEARHIATTYKVSTSRTATLVNGRQYTFWVRAINGEGKGVQTKGVIVTPRPSTSGSGGTGPTAAAKNLKATVVGDESVLLSWDLSASLPDEETKVHYEYTTNLEQSRWISTNSDATTYIVTGLNRGTTYTFWVRYVVDDKAGLASTPVTVPLIYTVPGQVQSLTVGSVGNRQVTLNWQAPTTDGDGAIIAYEYATNEQQDSWTAMDLPVIENNIFNHVVTGLSNGTIYTFWVRARNNVGPGIASDSVTTRPIGGFPGAVSGLTVVAGNASVELSWDPPATDGGSKILRYEWGVNSTWYSVGQLDRTHTAVGLDNGTIYNFQVRAINEYGAGDPGSVINAEPSSAYPGQVTGLITSHGNASVTLTWETPIDGDTSIIGYEYNFLVQSDSQTSINIWYPTGNTENSYTVRGLTNGTTYSFRMRAVNSQGAGTSSDTVTGVPTLLVLGPVSNLQAIGGNRSVILRWEPPSILIASDITRYEYRVGAGNWTNTGSTETEVIIDELDNDEEYTFAIRAVNDAGAGAVATIQTTTRLTLPGAVAGMEAAVGDGQVTLNWQLPVVSGGTPITGYEYSYTPNIITGWISTNSIATNTVISSLTNGTSYTFRVRAVNGGGRGPSSATITVTPVSIPGVPGNVAVSPRDGALTITWAVPTSNGGSPIVRYEYRENGGIWLNTGSTVTTLSLSRTNGVLYTYELRAVNNIGDGPVSVSVSGTPSAAAIGDGPVLPPPLSEHDNPFVQRFCGRIPGCPESVIFIAPIIAVIAVFAAGGRNPAILLFIGGGVMAIFLVILSPNIFTFLFIAMVAVASLLLWKFMR